MKASHVVLNLATLFCAFSAIAMECSSIRKILEKELTYPDRIKPGERLFIKIEVSIPWAYHHNIVGKALMELDQPNIHDEKAINPATQKVLTAVKMALFSANIDWQQVAGHKIEIIKALEVQATITTIERHINNIEENDTHLVSINTYFSPHKTSVDIIIFTTEIEEQTHSCCGKIEKYGEFLAVGSKTEIPLVVTIKENFSIQLIGGLLDGKYLIGTWSNESKTMNLELRTAPLDSSTKVSILKELSLSLAGI